MTALSLLFTLVFVLVLASAVAGVLLRAWIGTAAERRLAPRPVEWLGAAGVALLLAIVLGVSLWGVRAPESMAERPGALALAGAILGDRTATPTGTMSNLPPGMTHSRPRTTFVVPVVFLVVHLLIVLAGVAYLARARSQESGVRSQESADSTPDSRLPTPDSRLPTKEDQPS